MKPKTAPLLVLAIGNPSRGDDALGPLFLERARRVLADELARGQLDLLTDFQLQIEHAIDLVGRTRVVFVDSTVATDPPFSYSRLTARGRPGHTTHAMRPEQVLDTYRQVAGEPPEAWLLEIGGESFALGDPLSEAAAQNLEAALAFFVAELRRAPISP